MSLFLIRESRSGGCAGGGAESRSLPRAISAGPLPPVSVTIETWRSATKQTTTATNCGRYGSHPWALAAAPCAPPVLTIMTQIQTTVTNTTTNSPGRGAPTPSVYSKSSSAPWALRRNHRRLNTLVTAQALGNPEKLAAMAGYGRNTGRVIDKLVQDHMPSLRIGSRKENMK